MFTIAIMNQKGGSGKTTTAISLAAALAQRGDPTLLVDVDPQGHCALGLAIPEERIDLHIGDAMLVPEDRRLDEPRLVWEVRQNLHLIPSTTALAGFEAARGGLAARDDRDLRLAHVLNRFEGRYRWAIIDCPPSIGLLSFNALRAARHLLIPVELGYFALRGAGKQVATIEALARRFGAAPRHSFLPTMHDAGSALSREVLADLRRRFGSAVTPACIREDVRLKEAASLGVSVGDYAPRSRGAEDYAELAAWVSEHLPTPTRSVAEIKPLTFWEPGAEPAPGLDPPADVTPPTTRPAAPETPQPVSRSEPPEAPATTPLRPSVTTMTRAAELAIRARRLALRTEEAQRRRAADQSVSRAMRTLEEGTADERAVLSIQRLYGAHQTARGVLFVHPAPAEATVSVAGDHNAWSAEASPLRYDPALRVHQAIIPMPPGRHRYRLVVDGRWMTDPHNPSRCQNPYGAEDSVVIVEV